MIIQWVNMKRFLDRVVVFVFCLTLLAPTVRGMVMCVGRDGHTAVIAIGDDHCCPHEEQNTSSDIDSLGKQLSTTEGCCVDIPLSVETETKLLPSRQDEVSQSVTSCVASDIPGFVREIRASKGSVARAPTRTATSLAQIRTIVLLV